MRRRLFTLAAIASAVLHVGVGVFWVRSRAGNESVDYARGMRLYRLESGWGQVGLTELAYTPDAQPRAPGWEYRRTPHPAEPVGPFWLRREFDWRQSDFMWCCTDVDIDDPRPPNYKIADVTEWVTPWWAVWLGTGILPPIWVARTARSWIRRKQVATGRCPACGYDVRATPGRCPECGAVLKGAA